MLNEDYKVGGWRLTKSPAFKDIRDLLQEIKYSLDNPLETVTVDHCCKVKRQYESIFPGSKFPQNSDYFFVRTVTVEPLTA